MSDLLYRDWLRRLVGRWLSGVAVGLLWGWGRFLCLISACFLPQCF
ncbi:hypothetical protein NG798_07775 [Ancylothrix sp. C2]|nr:hypothetical protein [Ancylothrix sp. D3o]MCT7949682.1 hypothetical protein [Ancylothrix sp. D3o]